MFDIMCQIERSLGNQSFFVMDENFLFHRRRTLRLLELMEKHDKSWMLYVFSSASVLRSYAIEQLVALGISWVWMGLEGENSQYRKLDGIDTFALVRNLQSHGIRVLGSTIIGTRRTHAREHRPGHRSRRKTQYRLPPIHALHAPTGHATSCRILGSGAYVGRSPSVLWPTPTGNSGSITGIPTFHRVWNPS